MKSEETNRSTRSRLWILLLVFVVLSVILVPVGLSAQTTTPTLDGFKDEVYTSDSASSAYFGGNFSDGAGNVGAGATLYVYDDLEADGYIWMLWELEKSFVDNSYDAEGANGNSLHSTWNGGHSLDDLVESDFQRLRIYDSCNPNTPEGVVVDIAMDYLDGYSESIPLTVVYDTRSGFGVPDPPTVSYEGADTSVYYQILSDTSPTSTDWDNFDYRTSLWGNLNWTDYCEVPVSGTRGDCDNHGNNSADQPNDLIGSAGNILAGTPPQQNVLAESPSWNSSPAAPVLDDYTPQISFGAGPPDLNYNADPPTNGWEYAVMYEMRIKKSFVVENQCALPINPALALAVELHASPSKSADHTIRISNRDFGDLLDSYETQLEVDNNGDLVPNAYEKVGSPASHMTWLADASSTAPTDPNVIWLGAAIDVDGDGQPSTDALGDDIGPLVTYPDGDEDGFVPVNPLLWEAGATESVDILVSRSSIPPLNDQDTGGYIAIWFDWDQDGSFDDETAETQLVTWSGSLTVVENISFVVPADLFDQSDFIAGISVRVRLFTSQEAAEAASNNFTGTETDTIDDAYGGGTINGEVEDYVLNQSNLPVTVSFFEAIGDGDDVYFEWQTATETANVGFNIYEQTNNGMRRINEEMIPSHSSNSLHPQEYTYEASGIKGKRFFIEDVDIQGQPMLHGPFKMGKASGERVEAEEIDWVSIQAEHIKKQDLRDDEATALVAAALEIDSGTATPAQDDSALTQSAVKINLIVDRDGIYRVTYEDLYDDGFDLDGVNSGDLALLNRGQAVPIKVEGNDAFGPGSSIEFYGLGLDTLYTDSNVYTLSIDRGLAERIADDGQLLAKKPKLARYYMETVTVEDERAYLFGAPNGDPWISKELLVIVKDPLEEMSWSFDLTADDYIDGAAPVSISVGMWGGIAWPEFEGPDHHVIVALNNEVVTDTWFKGVVDGSIEEVLRDGLLQDGSNSIELTLPGVVGTEVDLVSLDSYGVTYPRAFVARDSELIFEAKGKAFRVEGLATDNVSVYRLADGTLMRLENVEVAGTEGNYNATFPGLNKPATYLVTTVEARRVPTIEPGQPYTDISSESADYLIISHPDFIDVQLEKLITLREEQGFTVKVVDVEDIYAQFGYGIFDAQAIKDYIVYAANNLGVTYVLLVGGDTYDYHGYLVKESESFIPSLYEATGGIVQFAPVDPLYADVDGDWVPDLALGRFPVRTTEELRLMVSKTLAYENKLYGGQAVYAAGSGFGDDSDSFIDLMPEEWTVERVYLDNEDDVDTAKANLVAAINNGKAMTSFVGHSSATRWTFDGLFSIDDAALLTNIGAPTVVSQWGCWNTYFVSPSYNTLAHKFLVSGEAGAAVVMGATTLSADESERLLGKYLTPRLFEEGMTVGEAMWTAKQELANSGGSALTDVLLGWTMLGDPAVVIQR